MTDRGHTTRIPWAFRFELAGTLGALAPGVRITTFPPRQNVRITGILSDTRIEDVTWTINEVGLLQGITLTPNVALPLDVVLPVNNAGWPHGLTGKVDPFPTIAPTVTFFLEFCPCAAT